MRTLHIIDIDDEVGPDACSDGILRWFALYRSRIATIRPGDQVIVGASRRCFATVFFALKDANIQRRMRSGPAVSIVSGVDILHLVAAGFTHAIISSGDGTFAAFATDLRKAGMKVHQVVGLGWPSAALARAVHTRSVIHPTALRPAAVFLPAAAHHLPA